MSSVAPSLPADVKAALKPVEAAAVLSMSLRSFQRHVQPRLKVLRVGGLVRIPVKELQRFVATAKADAL
jgi:hypothetical protein